MIREALFALGILILFAFMVTVQVKLGKVAWNHKADIHELTDEDANAMRTALEEWLYNPRIVKAMIDTKTSSREDLTKTLLALPAMTPYTIKSTAKVLLRMKDVRRVIAIQIMRDHGIEKDEHWRVLRDLAKWADIEAPRVGEEQPA